MKQILKGEDPNYENIQNMKLIQFCIKEALRMCPPAIFIARNPIQDEELIGYSIPKNQTCFLSILGVHYSEKYWEKPYEFNPKRWETIDEKKKKFCYFPFSVGPRDCAGRNLALVEASIVTAIVLQRYFIQFPENFNSDDVVLDSKFVMKLKNLQIQLIKRE